MIFEVIAQEWFEVKKLDIGLSQISAYKCAIKHLQPLFNMDIADIRLTDVQAIITDLSTFNPMTKRPTAKKTLRDIKHTARQIFQYAIDLRLIDYNPAGSVKIPRNAPKKTRRALTTDEINAITNTPHKLQIAAMIQLYGGLRRGEVIPLKWDDIDIEKATISVNKAVDLSQNTPVIKSTKTVSGNRIVHIPSILCSYLQSIEDKTGLVIGDDLYSATKWRKQWDKYTNEIGIPGVTSHMLRHTACTMMIEAGIDPSTVKKQMGHSNVKTTLEVYTHITEEHQNIEIEKLNDYIKTNAS